MQKNILSLIFLFYLSSLFAQSPATDPNWTIYSSDNFGYPFNNNPNWKADYNYDVTPFDWCNNPDNVSTNSNGLQLEAVPSCFCGTGKPLSVCQVQSWNLYDYGYFEAYIQYNVAGQYLWPAFWLWAAWHSCGYSDFWYNEIDNEILATNPYTNNLAVTYNVHYNTTPSCYTDYSSGTDENQTGGTLLTFDNTSIPYHKYGIEWDEDQIIWYFDDVPVQMYREDHTVNNANYGHIPCNPMSVTFDINYTDDWDIIAHVIPISMPQYMNVKYFNYYTLNQTSCPPPSYLSSCSSLFDPSTFIYQLYYDITINNSCISTYLIPGTNVVLRASDNTTVYGDFQVPLGAQFTVLPTQCFQQYPPIPASTYTSVYAFPCTMN